MNRLTSVIFITIFSFLVLAGASFRSDVSIQKIANDQLFSAQSNLMQINIPEAWDITAGQEIVVALIDTGVFLDHEDLVDQVWVNQNEIPNNSRDDDGNGYVDDYYGYNFLSNNPDVSDDNGHGTNITSIISAHTNNHIGIAAVNWHAKVMVLKALNDLGGGEYSHVAKAIRYAVNNGAQIINMSFGTYLDSEILKQAVDYAVSRNVTVIAAAGNNGQRRVLYPAAYDNVIAVGAVDGSNQRASFSNYGEEVDISAPGLNIPTAGYSHSKEYVKSSGTSYAAAQVSGLASLLLSLEPNLNPSEIKAIIKSSATAQDNSIEYNPGVINVEAALKAVEKSDYLMAEINTSTNSLVANGSDSTQVTLTVKNNYQTVSNRLIDFKINGADVKIDNQTKLSDQKIELGRTNSQGKITFSVSSSSAGEKSLSFFDNLTNTNLGGLKLVFNNEGAAKYQVVIVDQSPDLNLDLGETHTLWVDLKNTGSSPWFGEDTAADHLFKIGTSGPYDRDSALYHSSWVSNNRAVISPESLVTTNGIVRLSFTIKANQLGNWTEHFSPVVEYEQWLPLDISWTINVTKSGLDSSPSHYQAEVIEQSNSLELSPNESAVVNVVFKNTGTATWVNSNLSEYGNVRLGTYNPADRSSNVYSPSWISSNRVIESGVAVNQGGQLMLGFTLRAPNATGTYYESFRLVSEHITWFGPVVTWQVKVK